MPKYLILLVIANLVVFAVFFQSKTRRESERVLALQTSRAQEIQNLARFKKHWEKIVSDSPTYRDGYLQLAAIEYQLQNYIATQKYLEKAMEVDPNFELPITLSFLQPLVSLR